MFLCMRPSLPTLPSCLQRQICVFLCQEGDRVCAFIGRRRIEGISPHLACILSTAKMRKWRSILQGGVRELSDFVRKNLQQQKFRYSTTRLLSHDAHGMLQGAHVRNLIWPLALALHHSPQNRSRMVSCRPHHIVLFFLTSRASTGQDPTLACWL